MLNKELKDGKGEVYLTIDGSDEGFLTVSWKGKISLDNLKDGAKAVKESVSAAKVCGILNDNRELSGNWIAANDWIETTFIPELYAAGLRFIAHIFSPHFITKFSSIDLETRKLPIEFKTFSDPEKAEFWLTEKVYHLQ